MTKRPNFLAVPDLALERRQIDPRYLTSDMRVYVTRTDCSDRVTTLDTPADDIRLWAHGDTVSATTILSPAQLIAAANAVLTPGERAHIDVPAPRSRGCGHDCDCPSLLHHELWELRQRIDFADVKTLASAANAIQALLDEDEARRDEAGVVRYDRAPYSVLETAHDAAILEDEAHERGRAIERDDARMLAESAGGALRVVGAAESAFGTTGALR